MASYLFNSAKVTMLDAGLGLPAEGLLALLVNEVQAASEPFHPENAADVDRDDILLGAIIDTQTMTSVTVTSAGLVNCADFSFVNTTGSDPASEVIYFCLDTAVAANDLLLVRYDTDQTGLPVTPNGNNIDVDCSNGILQL